MDTIMLILITSLFLGAWFLANAYTKNNIHDFIEAQGGTLISLRWDAFGKSWFDNKGKVYKISYSDKAGNIHKSWVLANVFTGVYLSEDSIIEDAATLALKENKINIHGSEANTQQT
jgi:hypothetical protein